MERTGKPLIGVTASHNISTDEVYLQPYCPRGILAAGGIPVILPLEADSDDLRQLTSHLDGILFTGGPDVHPFRYGENTRMGCGAASVSRDRMELDLLGIAMEQKKPIMGICRGIQLINIGLGGTAYQDIPSQTTRVFPIAHQQPFPHKVPSHTVEVMADSPLAEICAFGQVPSGNHTGTLTLQVNSTHHQAVRDLAPELTAYAFAPDGIIEGVVMNDYPYLAAVQWHPEYLWEQDPAAMNLFKALVDAAGRG